MQLIFNISISLAAMVVLMSTTNAAPISLDELEVRGNTPSKSVVWPCTLDKALEVAAIKSLNGNALFWSNTISPMDRIEKLAKAKGKKVLRDVFPTQTRDKMVADCGAAGVDPWTVMSMAMASITTGEAWAFADAQRDTDHYFVAEMKILANKGGVTVYIADDKGKTATQLNLAAYK